MALNPSYEKDSGFNDIDLEERPGLYGPNPAPEPAQTPDFTPSYRQATNNSSPAQPQSYGTPGRSYRFATDEVIEDQTQRVNFAMPNGSEKTKKDSSSGPSRLILYILIGLVVLLFILTIVFIILYATAASANKDNQLPSSGAIKQTTTRVTTVPTTTTTQQLTPGQIIGQVQGQDVYKYMLVNSIDTTVELISLGARINRFVKADGTDVVPGFETTVGSNLTDPDLFTQYSWGAVSGRLCSESVPFSFNGASYTPRDGVSMLNFDGQTNSDGTVTFTKKVTNADDGLPGSATIEVTYKLTDDNSLEVLRKATGDSDDSLIDLCSSMKFNVYGSENATDTYITLNSETVWNLNNEWGVLGSGLQNFAEEKSILPLIDSFLSLNANSKFSKTYRVNSAERLKYVGRLKTAPSTTPSVIVDLYSTNNVATLSMDIAGDSQLDVTGKDSQNYKRLSYVSLVMAGATPGTATSMLKGDLLLKRGQVYQSMDVYKLE